MDTLELIKEMIEFDESELRELEQALEQNYEFIPIEVAIEMQDQAYGDLYYYINEKCIDIKKIIKIFFENYNQKFTEDSLKINLTCLENIYFMANKQKPENAITLIHKETRRSIVKLTLAIFSMDFTVFIKEHLVDKLENWIKKMFMLEVANEYIQLINVLQKLLNVNIERTVRCNISNFYKIKNMFQEINSESYIRDINMFDIVYEFGYNYLTKVYPEQINLHSKFEFLLNRSNFEFPFKIAMLIDAEMPKYIDYPNFVRPDISIKMNIILNNKIS